MEGSISINQLSNSYSSFVVSSPYQALCCIEAIKTFNIKQFDVYIMIYSGFNNRLDQIRAVFDYYGINYTIKQCNNKSFLSFLKNSIFGSSQYDISYAGDYYSYVFVLFAISLIRRKGALFYLDDGNSTISVLKGNLEDYKTKGLLGRIIVLISKIICSLSGIAYNRYFFTTFSDITNDKYEIYQNTFSHIARGIKGDEKQLNIFIGTTKKSFCDINNIEEKDYYRILKRKLVEMSRQSDLCYIVLDFCASNRIKCVLPEVCIELYLIMNHIIPNMIAGFTSTALYTIKKMYPQSNVINIRIMSEIQNPEYDIISSYYEQNGIVTEYYT